MKKEEKIALAEKIAEEMKKYKTIGIIDLFKVPTKEFKEIRKALENKAKIKVVKKSTLKFACQRAGEEYKKLLDLEFYQIALIFSNENPFSLFKEISSLEIETFAKENDIAEEDIWVYAGPTQIKAGPSISEFAKLKIPAGVEAGFIAVKKDTQVAKKGDKISKELASLLRKLKIKPIKVRLNVLALWHDGNIYTKEVLNLVLEYPKLLVQAYQRAFNLSVNIDYPTKENINTLITKYYLKAKPLKKFGGEMNEIYAALMLHEAKREINEENIKKILEAAGTQIDEARIKALVEALKGVNIDEALQQSVAMTTVAAPSGETKEEKKSEEESKKKEEEAVAGLASLFG